MTPPPAPGSTPPPATSGAASAPASAVFAALSGGGPGCFSAIAWEVRLRRLCVVVWGGMGWGNYGYRNSCLLEPCR